MQKIPLEIIMPIYNEGDKVIKLLNLFHASVKTQFRLLLCYDSDDDNIFDYKNDLKKYSFDTMLVKNSSTGPCAAVKEGINYGNSDCVIVYPADDFLNINIIDQMYESFKKNNDIVVASRFIKGGSMKRCPLIKAILVRLASIILYLFSSIPVRDASNGFRLFSRKLIDTINIESEVGFAYSLELLVKCNRLKFKIHEMPAKWEERNEVSGSRFEILKWLPEYLRWFFYGLETTWLRKGPEDVKKKI